MFAYVHMHSIAHLALDLHALIDADVQSRVVCFGTQNMFLSWVEDGNVCIRARGYQAFLRVQVEDLGCFSAAKAHKL